MLSIAVLISGGGTNLQAIIDSINSGYLNDVKIKYVISDKEGAYGLERAKAEGIETYVFDRKKYKDNINEEILKVVKGKVDLIVLAGYLSIIGSSLVENFHNRIINIHPSLIPSFCGKGMYGIKVHEAAISYGVKVSGCTVHFVDENTDTGAIILQRTVKVEEDDTAKKLQDRILVEEHKALTLAIKLIAEDKVSVNNRKVIIKG